MRWLQIGFKLVPIIVAAVSSVEKLIRGKGKEKQDAALVMIRDMLAALEAGFDRDLLDDAAVQDATRKAIDAIVALQNVIASRAQAEAAVPSAP